MKKLIAALLVLVSLTACDPSQRELTSSFTVLPEELKDCRMYYIRGANGVGDLTVVRCPNSSTSTSYKSGKTTKTVVTLD